MCLVFIAKNQHKDYPLIIAANRDEFYQRESLAMHPWQSPAILAGKDCLAGGTWLGLTAQGRFAIITNYREVPATLGKISRGQLVTDFLQAKNSADDFYQQLHGENYAGFNLVIGDLYQQDLWHFSNRHHDITAINDGVHGLSNALLNTPWPKVMDAKPVIHALCQQTFSAEHWFALLADRQQASDARLPQTGIERATERLLSSRFIHSQTYGTRCSTLITVNHQQQIHIIERSFDAHAAISGEQHFLLNKNAVAPYFLAE